MQKNISNIPVELIVPNLYQPRKYFNDESIEELAQSIEIYGVIQPISVRKIDTDKYELIAGERRLRAAKKVGFKKIPSIIINISDKDSAVIALLENLQREDLNFLEEAEAYQDLIKKHSYTQEKLAMVIGKKQSTIANKIRLLKLEETTRKTIIENKLTERHARALLKLPTFKLRKKILKQILDKSLNVKQTEQLINKELLNSENNYIDDKKKIKGVFSARVYMNTVKQIFDKYGIKANYKSKELKDSIQVIINIPKEK